MNEHDIFKKTLVHITDEIKIPNIEISIKKSDLDKLQKAHDAMHEFIYIPPHLVNSDEEYYSKSAFLFYHKEIFEQAHRSFIEALTGYYNASYILLRSTLEMLCKGAFWNCIAHKKFRDKIDISGKIVTMNDGSKKALKEWIDDIIRQNPSIENTIEKNSIEIIDNTSDFFKDEPIKKIILSPKSIIKQLTDWEFFDPIENPLNYIHTQLYSELSADVHVDPDKIDICRRIFAKKEIYETEIIPEELNKYTNILHKLMDIGIVVELNILEDIVAKNKDAKKWLEKRLIDIMELELNWASTKIVEMIK